MKILYHHRTLEKDGQNVHVDELISAFRRQHEVYVVGPSAHDKAEFGWDGGYANRIRAFLPGACAEVLEYLYSWVAYRKLVKAYRRFKPDLLYERYNLFLQSGAWLKKRYGLPFLLEVNSPLALERRNSHNLSLKKCAERCEIAVWKAADVVLPVTEELAKHVRDAGVAEDHIRVIANGVRVDSFEKVDGRSSMRTQLGLNDKVIVGFAGFVRNWHGLPIVLDVIRSLKARYGIHFLVIGDGPARPSLERRARDLGLTDDLTITGLVPRGMIAVYLAASDIAVQPMATPYASPLKLFEYMGAQLAIIAPDEANIREVLTHEKDALLFAPDDADAFRDSLVTLIKEPELRSRLGLAALQTIQERDYTWDGNASRIEEICSELTDGAVASAGISCEAL